MSANELFTPAEAGVYLGGGNKPIKPSTLQYWRTSEYGPPYLKLSWKEVRYRRCDLDAFLASRSRTGGTDRVEAAYG